MSLAVENPPFTSRRLSEIVRTRPKAVSTATIIAALALFTVLAIHRRWIADDGLIAVRTVRQILAGHGPVYNPFERAETNTSAAWTWVLAAMAWSTGADVARLAVWAGIVFAVAGYGLALFATRRFHDGVTGGRFVVPVGFLVILAVAPFWDFASSGLETGLCTLWIAACWWFLVGVRGDEGLRGLIGLAVLFGAGPLIRPDFGLVSVVFCVATWLLVRPSWRRAVLLAAVAITLPVGYEIFRGGFYGTLVPLPGLAKSAGSSAWGRGLAYFDDFFGGYLLWIPAVILLVAVTRYLGRHRLTTPQRIKFCTPVVAGLLAGVYVLDVGGDFMRGRMWLPTAFLIVLPILVLTVERRLIPALALVAAWAVLSAAVTHRDALPVANATTEDERAGYQDFTHEHNPTSQHVYVLAEATVVQDITGARRAHQRRLLSEGGDIAVPLNPRLPIDQAVIAGRLGGVGAATPLDDFVVDTLGLANPLGARVTVTNAGQTGHEKPLPYAWILAAYGDPAVVDHQQILDWVPPEYVRAARHAMSCGDLKRVLDAARKPMSLGRFLSNLGDSVELTRVVVPSDPLDAEKKFCGSPAS